MIEQAKTNIRQHADTCQRRIVEIREIDPKGQNLIDELIHLEAFRDGLLTALEYIDDAVSKLKAGDAVHVNGELGYVQYVKTSGRIGVCFEEDYCEYDPEKVKPAQLSEIPDWFPDTAQNRNAPDRTRSVSPHGGCTARRHFLDHSNDTTEYDKCHSRKTTS